MNTKDVTIIIPVHCISQQSLSWLDECLQSASIQSAHIVTYNDGSSVDVMPVLSKYLIDVALFDGINKGVSHARNQAISAVKTELIYPLDCDDRIRPGTISTLVALWRGVPVYSDLSKFGDEDVPHYTLLDFSCENVLKYVGLTSVNVLHSKRQWEAVGGYNENLEFFEDGEYNARLYARFCGVRYPKPLVEYRIHKSQRTQTYKDREAQYAQRVLKMIGGLDMACSSCGGARKSTVTNFQETGLVSSSVTVDVSTWPLVNEVNWVLSQYVGGRGRGLHYYNGPVSGQPYRVRYGEYLYARFEDTRLAEESAQASNIIRVVRPAESTPVVQQTVMAAAKAAAPAPAEEVMDAGEVSYDAPVAVSTTTKAAVIEDLPDIATMSVNDIYALDLTKAQAQKLLARERNGRNRAKVVDYLRSKAR